MSNAAGFVRRHAEAGEPLDEEFEMRLAFAPRLVVDVPAHQRVAQPPEQRDEAIRISGLLRAPEKTRHDSRNPLQFSVSAVSCRRPAFVIA